MISIHAPHAGSDDKEDEMAFIVKRFLSTLPMRGATGWLCECGRESKISIHAPHAGSDGRRKSENEPIGGFLSTLPMRGATLQLMGWK